MLELAEEEPEEEAEESKKEESETQAAAEQESSIADAEDEPLPEPPTESEPEFEPSDPDYENLFSDLPPSVPTRDSTGDDAGSVMERTTSEAETLSDHLLEQVRMTTTDPEIRHAAEIVISRLDADGFCDMSAEELAEACNIDPTTMQTAWSLIRTLDPPGVGARNVRECLLIQMERKGWIGSTAFAMIRDHFEEVGKNRLPTVARKLGVSLEEVVAALEQIKTLEPRPGRSFGSQETNYIVPDVIVEKVGGEYVVSLRNDGIPRLRVSRYYRNLYEQLRRHRNKDTQYLKDRLDSAVLLIKSLERRKNTLYRVAKSIVNHQIEFFEYGPKYLKPMTLRVVADDLQVHESTISRITTQKYMQTPRGTFEMKFFFTSPVETESGESLSARSVRTILKEIIESENPRRPYSDQQLAEILKKRGFRIARRTVTKYREQMNIPPLKQRIRYLDS